MELNLANFPIPEIPFEMKEALKKDRLVQYQTRIYQTQMDMVAYEASGDEVRLEQSKNNLVGFIKAYRAVEGM